MKENRFIFSFTTVDSKLMRKQKKFRPKNEYNMLQAEELIKWSQTNYGDNVIGVKCTDSQEGYEFVFDGIEVKSSEEFSLIEEVGKQININSHLVENAGKLITDINRQYQTEVESKNYKPVVNTEQTKFEFTNSKNQEIQRVNKSDLIDNFFS